MKLWKYYSSTPNIQKKKSVKLEIKVSSHLCCWSSTQIQVRKPVTKERQAPHTFGGIPNIQNVLWQQTQKGWQTFSVEGQTENILGFENTHSVSVSTIQLPWWRRRHLK